MAMSIFKRSSPDVQPTSGAPAPETITQVRQPDPMASVMPPFAAPGVLPPAAAPFYSTQPPEARRTEAAVESPVAEKVRTAREAQQSAQERIRRTVRHTKVAPPAPGVQRRPPQQVVQASRRMAAPHVPADPAACAQAGMLNLAWRWQEAGAPIRAIHTYVELLTRYPGTEAAAAAVGELVDLSDKLASEGQFHIALTIYDHLEHLA
jgi:hypothetical protein